MSTGPITLSSNGFLDTLMEACHNPAKFWTINLTTKQEPLLTISANGQPDENYIGPGVDDLEPQVHAEFWRQLNKLCLVLPPEDHIVAVPVELASAHVAPNASWMWQADYTPGSDITILSRTSFFTEPIAKDKRDEFVELDQMLMWICENGGMRRAKSALTTLKNAMLFDMSH